VQKFKVFAILFAGVLLSAPVLAQQTTSDATPMAATPAATAVTPAATAQPAAPADDPNEVICRKGEPILGSRFPGPRVCHTRKEWAQIQQDSQKAVFDQQMKRAGPGTGQ
jgi:hypothetical protein